MLSGNLLLSENKAKSNQNVLFTQDNKRVWSLSLQKKEAFIKKYQKCISQDYIDGFDALAFNKKEISTLETLNSRLVETGWQAVYVDGYLRQHHYAKYLEQKIVPISRYMRSLAQLDYAPGPDMLHDIFGHLPMLFSRSYTNYLSLIGNVMAQTTPNDLENRLYHLQIDLSKSHETLGGNHPQTLEIEQEIKKVEQKIERTLPLYTLLGRFFIWTVEFGILRNDKNIPQMYGAGLLSSENESVRFCEGKTQLVPFTADAAKVDFDFSSFQKQLFYSESFESLTDQLRSVSM